MLNVACVKVGDRYDANYVNTLHDMVRRNLPAGLEGRFICFTDDATGLDPAIHVKPVPKELAGRGWWAKLYLFSKDAFPEGGRVLYFDLDTVICGPIDSVAAYRGTFAILRDAYRPNGLQSSVMAWEAEDNHYLYNSWVLAGRPELEGGDQQWIERTVVRADILQDLFADRFRSYKVECRAHIPQGTSVVFFHGHPRPHEVKSGWVPYVWKVGGGSGIEWITTGNTPVETLRANVRHSLEVAPYWMKRVEPHAMAAVIVGGGPSLKETLYYVRGMKMAGARVFATGNTYRYLMDNGIQPDVHVLLDARAENIEFVPDDECAKAYASHCHTSVIDKAGKNLVCWHAALAGYSDLHETHPSGEIQIGGGTTVGMRAIALAYVLGHRHIRLFGFDSSYANDEHHAYPQKLNDGEKIVTAMVNGVAFKAAPWMVAQVEEYKELSAKLHQDGCDLLVYGTGLLPKFAEVNSTPASAHRANAILKRLVGMSNPLGAEIGVYMGALSRRLLEREDLRLYLVDCWAPQPTGAYADSDDYHAKMSADDHEQALEHALANVEFAGDRAILLRDWSEQAAARVADGSLDFVFIDADHTYEGCHRDIELWARKVKPGGWLMGHDYGNTDYPLWGVDRAVDEYAQKHSLQLETDDNFTWFMRLPAAASLAA